MEVIKEHTWRDKSFAILWFGLNLTVIILSTYILWTFPLPSVGVFIEPLTGFEQGVFLIPVAILISVAIPVFCKLFIKRYVCIF
jgi:hypothetical protein